MIKDLKHFVFITVGMFLFFIIILFKQSHSQSTYQFVETHIY